jgi:hypothetical protein
MGTIVRGTKSATGTVLFGADSIAKAAEVNTDFTTLYTEINGSLDNDNLDLSAISQTAGFTGTLTADKLTVATLLTVTLQSYTTNALAIAGGLTTGNLFRNGDNVAIVH